MVLESSKITIDDRGLLEDAALNLQQTEQALTEMPSPLAAAQMPITEVVKPSILGLDPLRLTKLYCKSIAFFLKKFKKVVSRIFSRNIAPSIGNKEEIEKYIKLISQAKSVPAEEKKTLLKCLEELKNKEIDKEEIDNRLKEFVLG